MLLRYSPAEQPVAAASAAPIEQIGQQPGPAMQSQVQMNSLSKKTDSQEESKYAIPADDNEDDDERAGNNEDDEENEFD